MKREIAFSFTDEYVSGGWRVYAARLFGRRFVGTDSGVTVEGYWLCGRLYVWDIREEAADDPR